MLSQLLRRLCLNLIVPIGIGLVAAQLLGGLLFGNPFSYWDYRFRYTTPDAFRNVGGFWTYRPDSDIRELTYYKRPLGDVFVASDCRYVSDELGFLDNLPQEKTYDVLLLGDSLAAGEFGCSWIGALRALAPGLSIYSAALLGTGVENWAAQLRYLSAKGYRFNHVIVVFIAEDFFRRLGNWNKRELRCLRDGRDCTPKNAYFPLEPGLDPAAASRARAEALGFGAELSFWIKRHFWVPAFISYSLDNLLTGTAPAIRPETDAALTQIMGAIPSIRLVKVNQKDEAALGADNATTIVADRYLDGRGIAYDRCTLRYEEFGDYDAHPTKEGYAHLARCVAAVARQLTPLDAAAVSGP